MESKSISLVELEEVLQKIKTVLIEAGFPKESVEIQFKNTDRFDVENLLDADKSNDSPIRLLGGCWNCNGALCCLA